MKLFRWGGLIGFVVIVALIGVIGFFFIDDWAKKGIEVSGFQVNQAEVDVGSVRLSLNPIGFELSNIQIADPDKPTHDSVLLERINLEVNLPQLFLGNVRIHDVTVAGVQSDVKRANIARVMEKKPADETATAPTTKDKVEEKAAALVNQLPTPKEAVLAQVQNTQTAVKNAEQTISDSKQAVESSITKLPTDDDLASYKKRIAEIKQIELDSLENIKKSTDLLGSVSKDVATDKLAIETVKRSVNNAVRDSKNAVTDIAKAPGQDWQALKEKYPLNKDTALKVARRLLGDNFFVRIDQAKGWYEKARPWLARLKSSEDENAPERLAGEYIRFPHPDPTAAFQLDHGKVSFTADNWPWLLTINDLTSHRGDFFKPTHLLLQRGTTDNAALKITGLLDRVDGKNLDTFEFSGRGIDFSSQSAELAGTTLKWVPEKADVSGKITSTAGQLNGKVSLMFPQNNLTASGSGATAGYLARAVQKVKTFQIDIAVSGTLLKPNLQLTSDLDNQLSDALAGIAKAEYESWLADARTQLDDEVQRLRKPADEALNTLERRRTEVEERIQRFETEVEQEVRSLENKVKTEQKRLQDPIAAEKKAAEEAAKKAAQDKAKEGLGNLKDKIGF
jgi:uncharacterized protein (TIGR03545 family)